MIDRLIRFGLLCLCVLPMWVIVRRPWKRSAPREISMSMFVAYISALLVMVLGGTWAAPADMLARARERLASMQDIHLSPFNTIRQQFEKLPSDESLTQLLGNSLLFMPWGIFLPMLWRRFRHPVWIALMCLALSCSIEFIQLFIGRMVDVDDLILNFSGSMCGAGLWWIASRLRKE